VGVAIHIEDLGIEKLKRDLAALAGQEITVGWQGLSGLAKHPEAEDETNAQVAAWMEYGTRKMPARPALRRTFRKHREEFSNASRKAISDLIDGRATSAEAAAEKVGDLALRNLRRVMDDARSWAEPLAHPTVKKKGHQQPWLDTGTLRDKASWAVREGNQIVRQGGEE
jgi:HK97 gp10 family phage protein